MDMSEALIFIIIVMGMILTLIPIAVRFSIKGNGKTDKLPKNVFLKNPRKYSFYCATSGVVGIWLMLGVGGIYLFNYGDYAMGLLLLIASVIFVPLYAWRIYHNLINLSIS